MNLAAVPSPHTRRVLIHSVRDAPREPLQAHACAKDLTLARNLSLLLSWAIEDPSTGIFGQPMQLQMLFQKMCSDANRPVKLCEVGFRTGHTALFFLEAIANSSVIAFGSGDAKPGATAAAKVLGEAYGARFQAIF